MFKLAIDAEILPGLSVNPAREVRSFKSTNEGYHTWSVDKVAAFEKRWPIGSAARLALALLLCTGQRRSDVVKLGPPHEVGRRLVFTQTKNANRKPVRLELPILAPCAK